MTATKDAPDITAKHNSRNILARGGPKDCLRFNDLLLEPVLLMGPNHHLSVAFVQEKESGGFSVCPKMGHFLQCTDQPSVAWRVYTLFARLQPDGMYEPFPQTGSLLIGAYDAMQSNDSPAAHWMKRWWMARMQESESAWEDVQTLPLPPMNTLLQERQDLAVIAPLLLQAVSNESRVAKCVMAERVCQIYAKGNGRPTIQTLAQHFPDANAFTIAAATIVYFLLFPIRNGFQGASFQSRSTALSLHTFFHQQYPALCGDLTKTVCMALCASHSVITSDNCKEEDVHRLVHFLFFPQV